MSGLPDNAPKSVAAKSDFDRFIRGLLNGWYSWCAAGIRRSVHFGTDDHLSAY